MIRSNLCDYSDAYLLVSRTIVITREGDNDASKQADERNKGVMSENCAPFTDCISNINNTQIDNGKYIDVVMPMYDLIEYRNVYRDVPANTIEESDSFKSKIKIPLNIPDNDNKKNIEIAVPLKYLSNFWRTPKMSLINC